MRAVIEWAPFRLRSGIREEELLAASVHLQEEFLARQEGFRSRKLLRAPDGGYVDLVQWESASAADRAMLNAASSQTCSTFFSLMEADAAEPGAGVLYFEAVAEYGAKSAQEEIRGGKR